MLPYFSSHIVDESALRESMLQIGVCGVSSLALDAFFPCVPDGPDAPCSIDARIKGQGARGVLLPISSRIIRLFDDEPFWRLFNNL